MRRASSFFSRDQRRQVERAVVEAESKTACEIVPVVATDSGRYDRAEDVVGVWLATLVAVALWLIWPRRASEVGDWSDAVPVLVEVISLIAGIVLGFILGAALGARIGWLRRLFTPRGQMAEEVEAAARKAFFDTRVHHTAGATGMLLYISLFERRAAVLADQKVIDEQGQTFLDDLCAQLTNRLGDGDPTAALCETITAAGDALATSFPRAEGDVDELENVLVLLDELPDQPS